MPKTKHAHDDTRADWQRAISRFFGQTWVELLVGVMVVVSVILTLLEFTLSAEHRATDETRRMLGLVSLWGDAITIIFSIELYCRYLGATSTKRYLREYWLDIIAVLPLFRAFRIMRLLRLLRVLRLFGVVSRLATHFPYVLRRGALEYLVVTAMLFVTVLFATGAIVFFEGGRPVTDGEKPFEFDDAFWFSLYSLIASEPIPTVPTTLAGKITAAFVMFMGLTIFAMFTGTVSAFMVERLRMEDTRMDFDNLSDHIVICGWNSKAMIIVREYRASPVNQKKPIVVITQYERDPPTVPAAWGKNIGFLNDDFTRVAALEKAGIHRCETCIVLADTSGARNEQDADARTILAALTVEKLNPDVYTCAELLNRAYGTHLQMGNVNDFVVSGEYGAYLLAQASMNRGLMSVYRELLTYEHGNELYRLALPDRWIGKRFLDVMVELKEQSNAILVAVHTPDGQMHVNPQDHTFDQGDEIVAIALDEFTP